jgi:hypothetical protein
MTGPSLSAEIPHRGPRDLPHCGRERATYFEDANREEPCGASRGIGLLLATCLLDMRLTTAAFQTGGQIPAVHTCDGSDVSLALAWEGPPPATKSFTLIVDDPDAPGATGCIGWSSTCRPRHVASPAASRAAPTCRQVVGRAAMTSASAGMAVRVPPGAPRIATNSSCLRSTRCWT